jgi:hypothetical protein
VQLYVQSICASKFQFVKVGTRDTIRHVARHAQRVTFSVCNQSVSAMLVRVGFASGGL